MSGEISQPHPLAGAVSVPEPEPEPEPRPGEAYFKAYFRTYVSARDVARAMHDHQAIEALPVAVNELRRILSEAEKRGRDAERKSLLGKIVEQTATTEVLVRAMSKKLAVSG